MVHVRNFSDDGRVCVCFHNMFTRGFLLFLEFPSLDVSGRITSCPNSSVGRALHRHRRDHGFESRLSPDIFELSFRNYLLKSGAHHYLERTAPTPRCHDIFTDLSIPMGILFPAKC